MAKYWKWHDDERKKVRLFCVQGSGKNRKYKTKTIPTPKVRKRDLEKVIDLKLDEFEAHCLERWSLEEKSPGTFEDYTRRWLNASRHRLGPSTMDRYLSAYENHIFPVIGHLEPVEISPMQIRELVANWAGEYKYNTLRFWFARLTSIFNAMIDDEIILKSPARNLKLTPEEQEEVKILTETETMKIIDHIRKTDDVRRACVVALALTGGLRAGEIAGLDYTDIDEINQGVMVRQNYVRTKSGRFLRPPKNGKSRFVTLPAWTMDLLQKQKAESMLFELYFNPPDDHRKALIKKLKRTAGHRPSATAVSNMWDKLAKSLNITPGVTLHGLRHTHVSILVSSGVDITTISQRVGHSSVLITLNVYNHLFTKADRTAADLFDDLAKGIEKLG